MFLLCAIYVKEASVTNLGIILSGKRNYQDLLINKDVNFYTLKGLLESLMTLFNINKGRYNKRCH